MAGQKGMRYSRPMSAHQRDNIALGQIEILLDKQMHGEIELDPVRLEAIKIRYSRLRPTLSAVEQTTISDDEKLSDAQLLDMLANLIEAHPHLVQQALAAKAKASHSAPTSDATSPVTPIISSRRASGS